MTDEELEFIVLTGLDTICEQYGINPAHVLKLMVEEGLVQYDNRNTELNENTN